MSDSENLSQYRSESKSEGIGSSSESELESEYLNESFQGMKLESRVISIRAFKEKL